MAEAPSSPASFRGLVGVKGSLLAPLPQHTRSGNTVQSFAKSPSQISVSSPSVSVQEGVTGQICHPTLSNKNPGKKYIKRLFSDIGQRLAWDGDSFQRESQCDEHCSCPSSQPGEDFQAGGAPSGNPARSGVAELKLRVRRPGWLEPSWKRELLQVGLAGGSSLRAPSHPLSSAEHPSRQALKYGKPGSSTQKERAEQSLVLPQNWEALVFTPVRVESL